MKTDIDRLHAIYEKSSYARGMGLTFAACHELAGVVEVGTCKDIICLLRDHESIRHILPMIRRVFEEHGLVIDGYSVPEVKLYVSGKTIRFISAMSPDKTFRGWNEHNSVDITM